MTYHRTRIDRTQFRKLAFGERFMDDNTTILPFIKVGRRTTLATLYGGTTTGAVTNTRETVKRIPKVFLANYKPATT